MYDYHKASLSNLPVYFDTDFKIYIWYKFLESLNPYPANIESD